MRHGRHAKSPLWSTWVVGAATIAVMAGGIGAVAARTSSSGKPSRTSPAAGRLLLADDFHGPDGLITNEYAAENPGQGRDSSTWIVTSGSLFRQGELGWSGAPDSSAPGPTSATATNSDVFRMITRRADFANVRVHVEFEVKAFDDRGPRDAFDGLHVFLRYQSPQSLLVVSVCRRDNGVAVKKKVEGGDSNGGTYYTLASATNACTLGQWHSADVSSTSDGHTTTIDLSIDGKHVLSARDGGEGGPALVGEGRVGVRGDYIEFFLRRFSVSALS